jgi:hypothetical protein
MHCASNSELNVAILWAGFVDYPPFGVPTLEENLLPLAEFNGRVYFFGADFAKYVVPLLKDQT